MAKLQRSMAVLSAEDKSTLLIRECVVSVDCAGTGCIDESRLKLAPTILIDMRKNNVIRVLCPNEKNLVVVQKLRRGKFQFAVEDYDCHSQLICVNHY